MTVPRPGSERSGSEQPRPSRRGNARDEAERRRRRAAVFGDVLPDSTSDERGHGSTEDGDTDDWIRRQVPPHHG
jgi:hypothetical protein